MKLTLTPEVRDQVNQILAPLQNPDQWKALELPFAPSASAIVRMEGAPGTGKTALANYMSRKMKKPPIHISFAGVASVQLGETEAKITATFNSAHETETPVIIMEECDAILWSRDKVSEDTLYQLGFINTLLTEIDRFINRDIPSLLILTTNYPQLLDSAMESRITDVINLFPPVGEQAERMWKAKLPFVMLQNMSKKEFSQLAELGATPRQMEKAIMKVCRLAMHKNISPSFADFDLPL